MREPLRAMLDELAGELGGEVRVFRQHRDVRFSPDKSPYKTRTYGVIGDRPGGVLYAEVSRDGEALRTAPRGYPRDHPRAALLRHKALFGGRRLAPAQRGIAGDTALDHARATWAACAELTEWLDAHVRAARRR